MNQLLNTEENSGQTDQGLLTAEEIHRQPASWKRVWEKINTEADQISSFMRSLKNKQRLNVVLTGAGSSAFIGDTASATWNQTFSVNSQAIPTTDLVTHFGDRINTNEPLLLISFARSGNSPESTAVIQYANALCGEVYHLIITCNPDGKLAQMENRDNTYVFLLPEETEDKSLAMTNSFTSMTLAAILIPKILSEENHIAKHVNMLSIYGQKIIEEYASLLYEIAQLNFSRIVFLGSGPLWGIAKESHLKVQELTNGQIIGKFDSFLGFRHGPKAIINDQTLVVYLLSNNAHIRKYEKDLIDQIAQHPIDVTTFGVAETEGMATNTDFSIHMGGQPKLSEDFWAILSTLPAQIIGFYKSILLGYNPDHPSNNGTISRVVEGVTIYDDVLSQSSTGDYQ